MTAKATTENSIYLRQLHRLPVWIEAGKKKRTLLRSRRLGSLHLWCLHSKQLQFLIRKFVTTHPIQTRLLVSSMQSSFLFNIRPPPGMHHHYLTCIVAVKVASLTLTADATCFASSHHAKQRLTFAFQSSIIATTTSNTNNKSRVKTGIRCEGRCPTTGTGNTNNASGQVLTRNDAIASTVSQPVLLPSSCATTLCNTHTKRQRCKVFDTLKH